MNALGVTALALAALVALPCAVLACECLAACMPPRRARNRERSARLPRTVVLVPAHDEEAGLPETLRSLAPELGPLVRVLVVAHNCSDRTAEVARAAGVEVLEARDAGAGGKPDALKAGLRRLEADPPEVVVIVDADCRVEPGSVRTLAEQAAARGAPVQGDYRLAPSEESSVAALSSLALLVKNVVRPTGLAHLGLPCLLNGAGSAYPFEQLRSAPHGAGSIAEDYQLAIDLALRGHAPSFVPDARVTSVLPVRREAALRQRRRWEHGHLALLCAAPGLVARGVVARRLELVALGLHLSVPPLAFLVLAWLATAAVALLDVVAAGNRAAAWVALGSGAALVAALLAALARFAGARAVVALLVAAPRYVAWKVPLYLGFVRRRETRWRKTERT